MEMGPEYTPGSLDFDAFIKNKLDELRANGSYRHFITIDKQAGLFPRFHYSDKNGIPREAVNWCTNDYLGLSTWSGNILKSNQSTLSSGTGSGGTRNISGSTIHHVALEEKIAEWHRKEKAILFTSAYQANQTTLMTLGRMIPDLIFISDEENHASLIEGMRATPNKKYIFKHNDSSSLESILNSLNPAIPKIIVFESVYSISGTLAPVKRIISLARQYKCLTYVDEVHAVGLYGPSGAGILEQEGLSNRVDFMNGTLSKAIGVFGGYIAASALWIDFIRSFGSGFIFTTSLPPSICATALTSINEIASDYSRRNDFFSKVSALRAQLDQCSIIYSGHETHITNIHIGHADRCKKISDRLLTEFNIYVQPINQPTVQEGNECLRVTVTPAHRAEDIEHFVNSLAIVLKNKIVLTGRSSRLSKAQIEIVKQKINIEFPDVEVLVKYKESRGDQLPDIPLHTREGIDFFTETISNNLREGETDIAVHSLKDMSSEHFFGPHSFAVIDRDEVRDIAIFNQDIIEKIYRHQLIRIGTCSFRREVMAVEFLKKALPRGGDEIEVHALPIRGNIETRLLKLDQGEYDGIILAVAGINRMYYHPEHRELITAMLRNKKIMVLPLIDCLPAPCQGAIVGECLPTHSYANHILEKIKDQQAHFDCVEEKRIASQYGSGCIQKFGVSSVRVDNQRFILAKGIDDHNQGFEDWYGLDIKLNPVPPNDIITSDELGFMASKSFMSTSFSQKSDLPFFIAHIAAINPFNAGFFETKRVWAAGTRTWFKLAQQGIWVEGCADSMGFKSIHPLLKTKLIDIDPAQINILTNETSARTWVNDGYQATGTYTLRYQSSLINKYRLTSAKMIFWNCYAHFDSVKEIIPSDLIHACLPGKTADLLKDKNIYPIVFPTLESFNQWKKKYTRQYLAA